MAIHVITHPLVQHKLGLMRAFGISTKSFRELCSEVGTLLTYEATKNIPLEDNEITSWDGNKLNVQHIKGKKITVVPILRAGLGMMDGVMQLLPAAKVSVVGLQRNEETLEPIQVAKLFEYVCYPCSARPIEGIGHPIASVPARFQILHYHLPSIGIRCTAFLLM